MVEAPTEEAPPTVAEVCDNFGLTDVDLEYSDADYQNLTTYKLFQQNYKQRIQAVNSKVCQSHVSCDLWLLHIVKM